MSKKEKVELPTAYMVVGDMVISHTCKRGDIHIDITSFVRGYIQEEIDKAVKKYAEKIEEWHDGWLMDCDCGMNLAEKLREDLEKEVGGE